jgi:Tol biopolymer transport system component
MTVTLLAAACVSGPETAQVTNTPQPEPTATSAPAPTNTPTPTAAATGVPPLTGSGGGVLAFVSVRDGNGEIYIMNADGSDQRRLTNQRAWDYFPTWSPDGKQIAFYTHLSNTNWVIQVMDVDGAEQGLGNPRRLTDNRICDGAPYWSPDGTRIAFTSAPDCDPNNREIVVMNADGSQQRQLTHNDADDYLSAWSPDSQQIAFVSDRDGNDEIYVMQADGSNPRRLTDSPGHDHMPSWSPDGTQIVFVSDRDGNDEIYVMDVDGAERGSGNLRRLTNNPTIDWFPFWSPDGSQLVFNSKRDGNLDVYVMDADGAEPGSGNVQRLTTAPGDDFNAVWRPAPTGEHATWIRRYKQDPRSAAHDAVLEDDGYLIVGATNYTHQDTAREDVHLMKIDLAGEMLWEKTYGGDKYDRGYAIIPAADGGYVILGETKSLGAGDRDVYLIKIDQDGRELWSKTFGGPKEERASAIQQTADGGYILTGQTRSHGAGGGDVYLVKTDGSGNEVWSQTYGGEHHDEGHAVHQTADGGFFVLAEVLHGAGIYPRQNPDVFLIRTDGTGKEVWSRVWEEDTVQGGFAMARTSDGGYVITGFLAPPGSETEADFLFLKVDGDGNLIWDKAIGDKSTFEYGSGIIETADGGYLLTGMSTRNRQAGVPLVKTNEEGTVVWRRNLDEGRDIKVGLKLLRAPDGGYLIVGQVNQGPGFGTMLIKVDSQGQVVE